uniref:Uncharacterized protein n=1 Tax=Pipistrellus kuhlii TaxID=59472 RepID=A0A7J7ZKD0_PIPKU|nr:hypothetical protein mPipKuh1_009409 [Pipistrellus kuhlii]
MVYRLGKSTPGEQSRECTCLGGHPLSVGPAWLPRIVWPPRIVHSFSPGCSMLMFESQPALAHDSSGSSKLNTLIYCSLIPERNPRDISRGALSLNAKNHDHSLDFKCLTSAFSADGGISVTQGIVICDGAPLQGNMAVQCLLLLDAALCHP